MSGIVIPARDWTDRDRDFYNLGYQEGEDSVLADFDFWFHDRLGFPDEWEMWRCKERVAELSQGSTPGLTPVVTDSETGEKIDLSGESRIICSECGEGLKVVDGFVQAHAHQEQEGQ